MKNYKIKIILFAFSLLIFQQCSSSTEPVINKNPREYTWTIDTLFHPESIQTNMRSIWGSSASDVYTAGHSDDIRGNLWHFDGKSWNNLTVTNDLYCDFGEVFGFSADNIWIAGSRYYSNPSPPPNFLDSTLILNFNGSWENIKPAGGRTLRTVWGSSPNDVWFGGLSGSLLFHWNGTSVKRDSIPYPIPDYSQISSISGRSVGDAYFLLSAPTGQTFLFINKQNNWSIIDSSAWFRNKVWVSDEGNIYETGQVGFYKWTGSSWTNLLGWFAGSTIGIEATSETNMFIVGRGSSVGPGGKYTGLVFHYNGNNFYLYENLKLDDVIFLDAWSNGSEVFIVGYTLSFPEKTIILHGK